MNKRLARSINDLIASCEPATVITSARHQMITPHLETLLAVIQKESRTRSSELVANFGADGFSIGWEWCVPTSFQPALDIFKTPVTVDKQTTLKLTQGSGFNFKEGDVLYRKKEAYTEDAIPSGHAVQVLVGQQSVARTKTAIRDCGLVEYEYFEISGGTFISQGKSSLTQDDFVYFLICNKLPKAYERHKELRSHQ